MPNSAVKLVAIQRRGDDYFLMLSSINPETLRPEAWVERGQVGQSIVDHPTWMLDAYPEHRYIGVHDVLPTDKEFLVRMPHRLGVSKAMIINALWITAGMLVIAYTIYSIVRNHE